MADSLSFFNNLNSKAFQIYYLQGVPNLNETFSVVFSLDKNGIQFQDNLKKNKFYLARKDIINISVEDQSTIQNRVGFTRLLLVGIFAFAWKKRQTVPLSFLIFEYNDEFGDKQEMYLQSESKDGFQNFTNVKYNLKRFWAEIADHPNADSIIENSKKRHQENKAEENANVGKGCLIIIIFFAVLYIISQLVK